MTAPLEVPERWRLCSRHAGYLVSDQGRVRRIGGRILKASPSDRGYLQVSLGRGVKARVHQLVAAAFLGPCPPGHHVDHVHHDKLDNRATQLRYLPALVNSVRWAGRRSDGGNLWETPDTPAPEDHVPLSAEERAALEDELAAAGWCEADALDALQAAGMVA